MKLVSSQCGTGSTIHSPNFLLLRVGQFNTFTFWDRTDWKIHPVVWNPWLLQTFSILYNCTRSLFCWSTGTSRGWWIFDLLIRRRSLAAYQNTSFHHHQWQKVSLFKINMLMWCDVSVMQKKKSHYMNNLTWLFLLVVQENMMGLLMRNIPGAFKKF